MDLTAVGGHVFSTHCLIKFRGRTTGKIFITPLCYGVIGGEIAIVASKGGADTHPQWYHNIRTGSPVDVQIATQAWRATWREPEGAERNKVWDFMVGNFPFYADYQESTDRQIPIIVMKVTKAIDLFRESDATGVRQR